MFNQISFFADLQQQQACYVDKKFKYQKKYREAYIVVHFPLNLLRMTACHRAVFHNNIQWQFKCSWMVKSIYLLTLMSHYKRKGKEKHLEGTLSIFYIHKCAHLNIK